MSASGSRYTKNVASTSHAASIRPATKMPSFDNTQKAAVESDIHKPLLITAGPGSGKTRTVVGRVIHLIEKGGVHPGSILALTFSKKATEEMRTRIKEMIPLCPSISLITIKTFHSFCLSILYKSLPSNDARSAAANYVIFSRKQQRKAIREIAQALKEERGKGTTTVFNDMDFPVENLTSTDIENILKAIEKEKSSGKKPSEFGRTMLGRFYSGYQDKLEEQNAIDFIDMIIRAIEMLKSNKELLESYVALYQYVMVDEFQDLNPMQFDLLQLLSKHQNVSVVGDEDQAIYGFRGGTSKLFDEFRKLFPSHNETQLGVNYRSTQTIVEACQSVISRNESKARTTITSAFGAGEKIKVGGFITATEEMKYVMGEIVALRRKGINYSKMAVLCRIRRNILPEFEQLIRLNKVPYVRQSKKAFSDRVVVNQMLSYLSLIANDYDDASFSVIYNIPKRGLTEKFMDYLKEYKEVLAQTSKKQKMKASAVPEKVSFMYLVQHAKDADYPSLPSKKKLTKKQIEAIEDFVATIESLREDCKYKSLPDFIAHVYDAINYEQYALREKDQLERRIYHKKIKDQKSKASSQVFDDIESDSDDEEEFENDHDLEGNMNKLKAEAEKFVSDTKNDELAKGLPLLRAFVDLVRTSEEENPTNQKKAVDAITISTIHQAKGLEWDHVFILRCNEGVMPYGKNSKNQELLEEERRLFYVAMSRAKLAVTVTHTIDKSSRPSRFLDDIPSHLMDIINKDKEQSQPAAPPNPVRTVPGNVQQTPSRPASSIRPVSTPVAPPFMKPPSTPLPPKVTPPPPRNRASYPLPNKPAPIHSTPAFVPSSTPIPKPPPTRHSTGSMPSRPDLSPSVPPAPSARISSLYRGKPSVSNNLGDDVQPKAPAAPKVPEQPIKKEEKGKTTLVMTANGSLVPPRQEKPKETPKKPVSKLILKKKSLSSSQPSQASQQASQPSPSVAPTPPAAEEKRRTASTMEQDSPSLSTQPAPKKRRSFVVEDEFEDGFVH